MDIKVIVAMHKPYERPADPLYLPLFVGAKGKEPFDREMAGDDTGDEISEKNASFCELTGLYWAWKNLPADAVGLVHYRRYFTKKSRFRCKKEGKMACVLTGAEVEELLRRCDIVTPKKRRYYIETLSSHYAHTHDPEHLRKMKALIAARCPQYLPSYEKVCARTWGYMFNMCIMKREELDRYCSWLFPLLFALEKEMEREGKKADSVFDARLYGRVSEILFNVWLDRRIADGRSGALPEARVCEVPTMHMEKIDWLKKGGAFLRAKFFGKKYSKSF